MPYSCARVNDLICNIVLITVNYEWILKARLVCLKEHNCGQETA